MPFLSKVQRPRWLSRKKSSASIIESDSGTPGPAASSEVSREQRRHSNISIRNSISSSQLLAESTEIQSSVNVIGPSDSIESPPAITPPVVSDPGRPLPLIKLEPAPIEALRSVKSTRNCPIPSSTPDRKSIATTTPDRKRVVTITPDRNRVATTTLDRKSVATTTPDRNRVATTTPERNRVATTTPDRNRVATTTIAIKSSTLWSQAVDKLEEEDRKSISGSRDNINLVEGFIGEIEKKQEECDKKRWFYTNSRGKNVFLLDGLVTQLNKYANIGDIALQHHPDVVSLAWSGFRFLLQVGTAYTKDMQTASESLEYLLRVLFCCDIYEKLYCETGLLTVQPLNTSLVELYVSILEYLCYIKRFLSKDTGERVLASFVSELKGLLKNVQQKESTVLSYVDKVEKEASAIERTERREETERLKEQLEDIKKPLEEIETAVKMVYEAIERDRKLNILRWLSDIKFIDHHTFSRERRQEKTGQWLEENETYKEWKNSKSSSLLWLRGDAGYGKTILISYVIDELQTQAKSNENMLAYFYCNYKEDNRRRPETVLRTLVKQFCLKSPGDPNFVPLPVSSIYVQRERDGHASGELRCQESTDLIINLSRMYHQVTIIVDALDECYNETRRELFLSLRSIVKSGSNVKVFLASRFEQDIALMFEGYKCHYIQASDNTQDINNYIDLQLNLHCDARRYGAEKLLLEGKVNEALKEEIRHTLKIKANGMFMWVNLQILALCEEPTPGLVRKALDQLPKDLNETYDRIIEKIEAKESSNNTAKLVLKWLLYAREPCTVKTITQALAVGAGENPFDEDALELTPSYIIDCCKNLVVEDSGLGKLRFAHFSVQEYLLRNPKFNNDLGNHSHMAEICLKALLNHHRKLETPCKVENLLDYATQHWGVHAQLSGSPPKTSIFYKLCMGILTPSIAYDEWVSEAVNYGLDFKKSMDGFVSPSWVACYYRLCDFSNITMVSKEMLNELNTDGQTPLSSAAGQGHDEVVELLLRDSRVDVNLADDRGQTPLSWAAEGDHDKVVELLLRDSRVDVNRADNGGQTPLSWAAEKGCDKVVELLLRDSRVDVNIVSKSGRTPLSWAADMGHNKVVELLLRDSHVDVNRADNGGQTALSWAAEKGHNRVVELLLRDSRVDVNLVDDLGRTPFSWVARRGHGKVIELLLRDSRVDVDRADERGQTPLSWAAEEGRDQVVELLLRDSRVDVNRADNRGQTPLSWAVLEDCDKVVELLLRDSRVDVNMASTSGQTPLSWAAEVGHDKVVELLLRDSRVDVNLADHRGQTALSWAAENGHDKVVELLLRDSHVDVNIASTSGQTPLSLAERHGHDKVVELLSLKASSRPTNNINEQKGDKLAPPSSASTPVE